MVHQKNNYTHHHYQPLSLSFVSSASVLVQFTLINVRNIHIYVCSIVYCYNLLYIGEDFISLLSLGLILLHIWANKICLNYSNLLYIALKLDSNPLSIALHANLHSNPLYIAINAKLHSNPLSIALHAKLHSNPLSIALHAKLHSNLLSIALHANLHSNPLSIALHAKLHSNPLSNALNVVNISITLVIEAQVVTYLAIAICQLSWLLTSFSKFCGNEHGLEVLQIKLWKSKIVFI